MLTCIVGWVGSMRCRRSSRRMISTPRSKRPWPSNIRPISCISGANGRLDRRKTMPYKQRTTGNAFQHCPHAQVAQLVEQRTENPRVGGSIPPLGTTFFKNLFFGRNSPASVHLIGVLALIGSTVLAPRVRNTSLSSTMKMAPFGASHQSPGLDTKAAQ